MAKAESDGKIPKRIGDLSFYKLEGEMIARNVSGFTTDGLLKDAKYELSRKNANEFGKVSSTCKHLRITLQELLPKSNNLTVVNAFTKKMRQILEYDIVNARGTRNLASALNNDDAVAALAGYNFNPECELNVIYSHIGKELKVCLPEIIFPENSNCIGFRVAELEYDFDTNASKLIIGEWLFYGIKTLPKILDFLLLDDMQKIPFKFVVLEMQFYDEDNGNFIPIANDRSKAVIII